MTSLCNKLAHPISKQVTATGVKWKAADQEHPRMHSLSV